MSEVTIWYPELPPTVNHLYYQGTRLTDKARAYRERFKLFIVQNYLHEFQQLPQPNEQRQNPKTGGYEDWRTADPNLVFGMIICLYMDCLTSWGDQTKPKAQRARFRFAKSDVTNRVKFIEDCFKYATDTDDSLTFISTAIKVHSPNNTGVYIRYFSTNPEEFRIPSIS